MASVVQQFTARGDPHRIKVMLLAVGTDCSGLTLTVANHLFVLGESWDGAALWKTGHMTCCCQLALNLAPLLHAADGHGHASFHFISSLL